MWHNRGEGAFNFFKLFEQYFSISWGGERKGSRAMPLSKGLSHGFRLASSNTLTHGLHNFGPSKIFGPSLFTLCALNLK